MKHGASLELGAGNTGAGPLLLQQCLLRSTPGPALEEGVNKSEDALVLRQFMFFAGGKTVNK